MAEIIEVTEPNMRVEVNAETNEVTVVEMTPEEIAAVEAVMAQATAVREEEIALAEAKKVKREEVLAVLATATGISADDLREALY
jgi:hypothetical protein